MASALDTIAHVVLPNLMKLKGAATLVSAIERRDTSPFAQVWQQTGVAHTPQVIAKEKNDYRIGVMSLPAPKEMGEAYMCAFVAKKNDAAITRYFTLEHDYVLATKQNKTVLCEREGQRTAKKGDGPPITGDFQTDATAFVDALMEVISPTKVNPNRSY
ncbi:MAG: hypothetical protein JO257_26340 [Deltaproteobacteria bacterium]|nr:hypothetical protein [Deltaproteobacteria bacterium]